MNIGILEANEICYDSLHFFLDGIENALKKKGIKTYRISEFTEEVLTQHYDAMIGINSPFISALLPDGTYLMDFFSCPFFDILLDAPYYHHSS